jgi:hypothetical protein
LKTPEEVEEHFPGFLAFIHSIQSNRFQDLLIKIKERYIIQERRKETYCVKNQIMVNNRGYILHKVAHKKKEEET